jgi:phage terminase large subunit
MKTITWKLAKKQADEINAEDRLLWIEGSAGAGKTIYAAHKTIKYALENPKARLGVFRETFAALKPTSLLEIRELLDGYGIPYKENKAEHTIRFPNGATIFFRGLDDFKKIRSLNLDFIWVEQAEETTYFTYQELKRRLRGEVGKKSYLQFILTYTPELEDDWNYTEAHRKGKGRIIHFSYKDNPFLPESYIKDIEELEEEDPELWIKYGLGEFGKLTNRIYNKWDEKPLPREPDFWTAGVDFGYNNPAAFLLIGWIDGEPYIHREIYQRHLTNTDLIQKAKELLETKGLKPEDLNDVICDAAEPDRIEEFYRAGFNADGGVKNIEASIDRVKTVTVHIDPECVNTKREIKSYKYKKDKEGNILEIPVDKFNHAMDAMRYIIFKILGPVESPQEAFVDEVDFW